MKAFWRKVTAVILVFIIAFGEFMLTVVDTKAAGIVPDELVTAYAGDRMVITTAGEFYNLYQTTNYGFIVSENTVAHIWAYSSDYDSEKTDEENEEALKYDKTICSSSFSDNLYTCYAGDKVYVEVQYGSVQITYNTANHGGVPNVDEGSCTKLEWL